MNIPSVNAFRNDARFAYNLSPNDSLQSINDVKGDDAMRKRLAMLKVDPLSPNRCPTTFGAYESESYVELLGAPPLVWSLPVAENRRGRVTVTSIHSAYLKKDKKLWVYTPVGFRIPTDSRKKAIVIRYWSCLTATGMSSGFRRSSMSSSPKGAFLR